MGLSQETIEEFKEIYKKEKGKELSDAEASEAAHNLVNFFDLLWQISIKETKKKRRLKKELLLSLEQLVLNISICPSTSCLFMIETDTNFVSIIQEKRNWTVARNFVWKE